MTAVEGLLASEINERLAGLGFALPEVPAPLASYKPAAITGDLVFTAGQLPLVAGEMFWAGKVGATVTVEEAQRCAEICAVNALAAVFSIASPSARIAKIVKVTGFVASAPEFFDQPSVVDGASNLFSSVFEGEIGAHARSAVGVAALPLDSPVEVEIVVRLDVHL